MWRVQFVGGVVVGFAGGYDEPRLYSQALLPIFLPLSFSHTHTPTQLLIVTSSSLPLSHGSALDPPLEQAQTSAMPRSPSLNERRGSGGVQEGGEWWRWGWGGSKGGVEGGSGGGSEGCCSCGNEDGSKGVGVAAGFKTPHISSSHPNP